MEENSRRVLNVGMGKKTERKKGTKWSNFVIANFSLSSKKKSFDQIWFFVYLCNWFEFETYVLKENLVVSLVCPGMYEYGLLIAETESLAASVGF